MTSTCVLYRARRSTLCALVWVLFVLVVNGAEADSPNAEIYEHPDFKARLGAASEYMVVVLPMQNLSLDGAVAEVFRQRVQERLRNLGYTVIDDELLDQQLSELGVTHAGQLSYISIEKLNQMVGADAYMYGMVEQAAKQNAVVYNAYSYSCSLQLHDRTGEVIWSAQQERIAKRRFSLDPINALLDPMLVGTKGQSEKAVQALADRLLSLFPQGPVKVQYQDPLLEQAVEIKVEEY